MMIEVLASKIPNMCYPGDFLTYADGSQSQTQIASSCLKEFLGVCFEKANNPSSVTIFGFSEFVTALALLILIYQFTDIRSKLQIFQNFGILLKRYGANAWAKNWNGQRSIRAP